MAFSVNRISMKSLAQPTMGDHDPGPALAVRKGSRAAGPGRAQLPAPAPLLQGGFFVLNRVESCSVALDTTFFQIVCVCVCV